MGERSVGPEVVKAPLMRRNDSSFAPVAPRSEPAMMSVACPLADRLRQTETICSYKFCLYSPAISAPLHLLRFLDGLRA